MTEVLWYMLLVFPVVLAITWPWIVEWYVGGPWKFDFE